MSAKPTPADLLAVQMAVLTRFIVHLDERGAADAQGFAAELLQLGRALPAAQGAVLAQLCQNLQSQTVASRARRGAPTGGTH